MAVFHCDRCDQWLDDDWHPMVEYKGRIMCDECEIEASADDDEESENE